MLRRILLVPLFVLLSASVGQAAGPRINRLIVFGDRSSASITGSIVLALAVVEGYIPGAYAFELSRIDETYQAEKWGADAEAVKRATALAHELDKAVEMIAAVR